VNSDLQEVLRVVPPDPTPADVEELRAAWRDAAEDAGQAWHRWCDAPQDQQFDAYVAYVAACDRETVAAELLRRYHHIVLPRAHRR
jgi:hypothetical protein